jgi:hypothetical protein
LFRVQEDGGEALQARRVEEEEEDSTRRRCRLGFFKHLLSLGSIDKRLLGGWDGFVGLGSQSGAVAGVCGSLEPGDSVIVL